MITYQVIAYRENQVGRKKKTEENERGSIEANEK